MAMDDDALWETSLVDAITNNTTNKYATRGCTPFIGAGLSSEIYPELAASKIVNKLRNKYKIPQWVSRKLHIASQFLAVKLTPDDVKIKIVEIIEQECKIVTSKHMVAYNALKQLAQLPFPLYITTNYDNLLEEALTESGKKPITQVSNWFGGSKDAFRDYTSISDLSHVLQENSAVVFHIHGYMKFPKSLVLTDEDYVDFLIAFSKSKQSGSTHAETPPLIPSYVEQAFSNHSLLLIGYSMEDINFRVLLRAIRCIEQPESNTKSNNGKVSNLSILLPPHDKHIYQQILYGYISDFFDTQKDFYIDNERDINNSLVKYINERIEKIVISELIKKIQNSEMEYIKDFFKKQLLVNTIWENAISFINNLAKAVENGA